MRSKGCRKFTWVFCLLFVVLALQAQYVVRGGNGTPLMAKDDTPVQVYLLNGLSDAEISYTSSSGSHQWYRYKTNSLDAERVNSTQQGTTSFIRGIEDGYGYFVQESGLSTRYIWVIDYSKYPVTFNSLTVAGGTCEEIRLNGSIAASSLTYRKINGDAVVLNREYDITYWSLEWSETNKSFSRKEVVKTVSANPFTVPLDPPLTDTSIRLSGDLFARHFGVEESIETDTYEAVALEVHAEMVVVEEEIPNMSGAEGYSAPVTILFTAKANEQVAALYIWSIYREDDIDNPLVRFTGEEVEYTFRQYGNFIAELEVTNRTGNCTNTENAFSITVSESFLDIPNAFSPGTSPGYNDEFKVAYKSLVRFKGWIFNRWGVEMFHWTDPSKGWDGKKGGKYVAPGVYFYVIEAEGSDGIKYKKKGDINILRSKTIQEQGYE